MVSHREEEQRSGSASASSVLIAHMPGLDLLRGVAILAVIFFHGLYFASPNFPWHNRLAAALFHLTGNGWIGVNLFFTLSGFLITGNLIDSQAKPNYYTRFYLRRALRILPAYFLVLLILGLTRTASPDYLLVCVIFLANWPKLLLHGSFIAYPVFWSLAVEEQFYAVWPWLYRKFRNRGLLAFCVAIIVLCPVLRGVAISRIHRDIFSKTFMVGDNLAVGAVVALVCRWSRLSLRALVWVGTAVLCVSGAVILILTNTGHTLRGDALGASAGYSSLEWLTGGLLILMLYAYRNRPLQPALRILVFFAEISYGLYLVDMLCGILYDGFFGDRYLTDVRALLTRFIIVNAIAVLLATLSRRYFEDPIMRLRRKIPAAN
ncbi:MAG TPA: acyltransferase [Edaphobacter sp.]|nr:acyltransferase [Edaphobacter sp.]